MLLWQMAGKGKIFKGSRLKSRVNDSSYFILTLFAIIKSHIALSHKESDDQRGWKQTHSLAKLSKPLSSEVKLNVSTPKMLVFLTAQKK